MTRSTIAIFLFAACGGDNVNHLADAPATADAPPDTPPEGVVTLTVTSQGEPATGVQVYFNNPDGSLVAMPTTDANGVAMATVRIGATVTDIDPPPPPPVGFRGILRAAFGATVVTDSLHSWAGVKPGDQLHLDLFAPFAQVTNAAMTVTVPTDPAATQYTMFTSCGGGEGFSLTPQVGSGVAANPPVAVNLPVCAATQDVLVATFDDGGVPQSAFIATDIAIADDTTLDLSGSTYTAVTTANFNYTNINVAGLTSIGIVEQVLTNKGRLSLQNVAADVVDTAATTSLGVPTATIATTISDIFASPMEQLVIDWGATGDVAVDFSTALLHPYTGFPSFDTATDKMSWSEGAGGIDGDLVLAVYNSSRTVDTTVHQWTWSLAAPRGATPSVTYPTIPVGTFDFNPAATDEPIEDVLVNAKVPGGYDAVRGLVYDLDPTSGTLVVGATGRIVLEQVAPPPSKPRVPVRKTHRR